MRRLAVIFALLAMLSGCGTSGDAPITTGAGGTSQARQKPAAPALDRDWPVFRGDAAGTGVAETELVAPLKRIWKFTPGDTAFEATPAIVGNRVFIGDADKLFYALNLKTGEVLWTAPGDRGFLAAPAVRNGRVFIGDSSGVFHCFDAASGHEYWQLATKAEINSSANFFGENVLFGTQGGTLYCLRCDDGKEVWKFTIDAEGGIQSSPTLAGTFVYFAGCDGKLHVIDVTKGTDAGQLDIGDPTLSTPAVSGDFAYFGTEGGNFFAVAWRKPKVQWMYRNPRSGAAYRSSAAVKGDLVIVAGRSKSVDGLRRSDGKQLWSFPTGGRVDSSPVIVGEQVFFGSADGRLYALDLKGKKLWKFDAGGSFLAGAAAAHQRLVIGNENGTLYCFGPE